MSGGGNLEHPFWRPGDGDGPALEQEIRSDGAPRDRSERRLLWRGFALLRRIGHDRLLFLCHAPLGAAPLFETRICPTPFPRPRGGAGICPKLCKAPLGAAFRRQARQCVWRLPSPPPGGGGLGICPKLCKAPPATAFRRQARRFVWRLPTPPRGRAGDLSETRQSAAGHGFPLPGAVALPALRPGG